MPWDEQFKTKFISMLSDIKSNFKDLNQKYSAIIQSFDKIVELDQLEANDMKPFFNNITRLYKMAVTDKSKQGETLMGLCNFVTTLANDGLLEVDKEDTALSFVKYDLPLNLSKNPINKVKRYDGPLFAHPILLDDAVQGEIGDCCFVSAVRSLIHTNPTAIMNMMHDNNDGTVSVKFFDNREKTIFADSAPFFITVTKDLPVDGFGNLRFGRSNTQNTWFPLLEKAAICTSRQFKDKALDYFFLEGYQIERALMLLTNADSAPSLSVERFIRTSRNCVNFSGVYNKNAEEVYSYIDKQIKNCELVLAYTPDSDDDEKDGIFRTHSHSIFGVVKQQMKIYDPDKTDNDTKTKISQMERFRDCYVKKISDPTPDEQLQYEKFENWIIEDNQDLSHHGLSQLFCDFINFDNKNIQFKQTEIKFVRISNPHGRLIREYANLGYDFKPIATCAPERSGIMCIELNDFMKTFSTVVRASTKKLLALDAPRFKYVKSELDFGSISTEQQKQLNIQLCINQTQIVRVKNLSVLNDKSLFAELNSLMKIEFDDCLTTIGDHSFFKCKQLLQVDLPQTTTKIEDFAFSKCQNLKKMDLFYVESIGENAFSECTNFLGENSRLYLPNCKEIKKSAFSNSKNIRTVCVSENCEIDPSAFPSDCVISRIIQETDIKEPVIKESISFSELSITPLAATNISFPLPNNSFKKTDTPTQKK